ncbi:carboxypeptidase A1-like, partial [Daphnia magna]|uniref:carboxypeptidase A1-like n=1 Tax=Daphnia magna TaxID=35525 RepID=UPI001E1BBA51
SKVQIVQAIISSGLSANKPVHFFDCNIHAREWITAATCVWIIDQITTGYGSYPEITSLVDQYDWKFVPIANPDGYAYTWNTDRNWRKNRLVNNESTCVGVDANRNFPIGFAGSGSSSDPCSGTYHGIAAFSEREASAFRDLIAADRGRVKTTISHMHSYSQMFLSPYGYTTDLPAEYPEMFRAMEIAVNALTSTYGTPYTYGNTAVTICKFITFSLRFHHRPAGKLRALLPSCYRHRELQWHLVTPRIITTRTKGLFIHTL